MLLLRVWIHLSDSPVFMLISPDHLVYLIGSLGTVQVGDHPTTTISGSPTMIYTSDELVALFRKF